MRSRSRTLFAPVSGRSAVLAALLAVGMALAAAPAPAVVIGGPFTCGGNTYFVLSSQSWPSAEAEAVGLGGNLATINDAAENACALGLIPSNAWIGFNDIALEGSFVWSSGQPTTYTNWNPGEPNNSGGEDCTELLTNSRWNDLPCGVSRFALAEIPNVQVGYTTSGSLRQGVAAVAGDVCTASVWVGKRADGVGTWGYWYLQLTNGSWTHTVMFGSLASQSAEWVQYSKTFTVPAFLSGALSLQLTGYYGWESFDMASLECGGPELVANGSFELPAIPDGQWSPAFGNPPPASWTPIGGAGHFNPSSTQHATLP